MPDILSLIFLALAGLLIIGPRRLPQSLEALWLALTDFQRTQRNLPTLGSLYNARRYWISTHNNIYAGIQILYQVTVHLEELRRRIIYVLVAFVLGFALAFAFKELLLGYVIRPVRLLPPQQANNTPVNRYVLTEDVTLTTTVVTASGPVSSTLTLPAGTSLPLSLSNSLPVVLKPTELFATYMKLSIIAGFAFALPMILLQLILFLRGPKYPYAALSDKEWRAQRAALTGPALAEAEEQRRDVYEGLRADEVRPMYLLMPLALVLFVGGVLFTYFLILPNALEFLFSLGGNLVQPLPSLEEYMDFALGLIFWVGVAFELPLVMFFLSRFGVVSARQFARQWRYAVVIIAIIAAVITPTVDVFNMSLVALPMVGLYVLGIAFAWLAHPGAKPAPSSITAKPS